VGWSSLSLARCRRLTSLVVDAGTTLPDPSVPAPQLVRVPHLAVRALPGLTRVTKTAPQIVPCGTKRAKVGTPSVVSRAHQVAPGAERRLSRLSRVSRCHAHRSHPEAGPRCVRQHAVRSASGPAPCCRFALRLLVRQRRDDASDRLLPSHFFVRAPVPRGFPSLFLPGESPGSRQDRLASADHTLSVCRSSREALSSSREVCGRASDILVAAPTLGPVSLARLVPRPRTTRAAPRSTA